MTDELVIDRTRELAPVREQPTPMELYQAALERGVNSDELGKILDLQRQWKEDQAREAYAVAMNAAVSEMPTVVRDAENAHSKARYARLETVARAIKPVYTRHGFSISFDTEPSALPDHIRMRADVLHSGGHCRQYHADIPIDGAGMKGGTNKTATQATGSTYSYGRRYLTLLIFNVTIANEDDDGIGQNAPITAEQVKIINDLIADCERAGAPIKVQKFLEFLYATRIEDIRARMFPRAVHELNQKRRAVVR